MALGRCLRCRPRIPQRLRELLARPILGGVSARTLGTSLTVSRTHLPRRGCNIEFFCMNKGSGAEYDHVGKLAKAIFQLQVQIQAQLQARRCRLLFFLLRQHHVRWQSEWRPGGQPDP